MLVTGNVSVHNLLQQLWQYGAYFSMHVNTYLHVSKTYLEKCMSITKWCSCRLKSATFWRAVNDVIYVVNIGISSHEILPDKFVESKCDTTVRWHRNSLWIELDAESDISLPWRSTKINIRVTKNYLRGRSRHSSTARRRRHGYAKWHSAKWAGRHARLM